MSRFIQVKAVKGNDIPVIRSSVHLMDRGIPEEHHECILKEWCTSHKDLGMKVSMQIWEHKALEPLTIDV